MGRREGGRCVPDARDAGDVGERTSLAASREVYVSLGWESRELKGNERGGWWP